MSGMSALLMFDEHSTDLLGVTTTPPSSSAGGLSGAPPHITPSVSAVVTGGSGSYTYAWTIVGTNGASVTSPSSVATTFSFEYVLPGDSAAAVATCRVTDTATGITGTVDVPVLFVDIVLGWGGIL